MSYTKLDRTDVLDGYYPSRWPENAAGIAGKRQLGRNFCARGDQVVSVANGRWNVMTIHRGLGALSCRDNARVQGPPPFGWLQKLDPESLSVISESRVPLEARLAWCDSRSHKREHYMVN